MSRKVIIWIAVGLAVALPTFYWLGLYAAQHTDAFAAAEAHVRADAPTAARVGEVKEVSIAPFGYKVVWGGSSGEASFKLRVSGTKGNATMLIELRERDNRWTVTRMSPA